MFRIITIFSSECRQFDSTFTTFPRRVHYVRTGGSGARMCTQRYKTHYRLRPFRLQGNNDGRQLYYKYARDYVLKITKLRF